MASRAAQCFAALALVACTVDHRRLDPTEPPPLTVIDGTGGAGAIDDTGGASDSADHGDSGGTPASGDGAGDQGGAPVDAARPITSVTSWSFDAGADTADWLPDDGIDQSVSEHDAESNPDSGSLLVTGNSRGTSDDFISSGTTVCVEVEADVTYDVAAQVEIDAGQSAGSGGFDVEFLDGPGCNGGLLEQDFFLTATTGAWVLGEKTPAAPAGARTALFRLLVSRRASDPPLAVRFDDVRFEAQ
jgi:hypothetical protein